MNRRNAIMVAILVVQFFTMMFVMETRSNVREIRKQPMPSNKPVMDKIDNLRSDMLLLVHPEVMTRRMIDWGSRTGEFEGVK